MTSTAPYRITTEIDLAIIVNGDKPVFVVEAVHKTLCCQHVAVLAGVACTTEAIVAGTAA